ncbi:arrestin domain-containing protein 3-like [Glandiceps talaboti]
MGKLKAYNILFEGNKEVYNAGEAVNGCVVVELSEPLQCRGVRVTFIGEGRVRWTESEGSGDHRRSVTYSSSTVYFNECVTLWGKEVGNKSGENPTLPAAVHQFPFRFQLPPTGLPSSFEGIRYGSVRYIIKSNIDRPWKFDHNSKRAFTVSGFPLDLNRIPDATIAQQDENQKTVCCLCCASGPIIMTATIDRKGYVPGDTIMTGIDVSNNSSRNILDSTASLVQLCTFTAFRRGHGRMHTRTTTVDVSTIKGAGCGPNDTISWRQQPLPVPAIPASGLEGFNYINIEYYVKFEADISGTPLDLEVKLPVIIGTIPLQQVYARNYNMAPTQYSGVPPSIPGTLPPPPQADQGVASAPFLPPPPSYESIYSGQQSIKDDEDNEYTFGQTDFAPKYAYYNWNSNPTQ